MAGAKLFEKRPVQAALVVVALLVAAAAVAIEFVRVPAESMLPSIEVGSHVAILRRLPGSDDVPLGQVVMYRDPTAEARYLERVIAGPGQSVRICGRAIEIDGEAVPQQSIGPRRFVDDSGFEPRATEVEVFAETIGGHRYEVAYGPGERSETCPYGCDEALEVPADHVYVLGDYRTASVDSRLRGPIPIDALRGRSLGTIQR